MPGRIDLKKHLAGPVVGALASVVVGAGLLLLNFPAGMRLIHLSYDLPFLFRPIIKPTEVVMVYMDEDSHRELGQPRGAPWDRGVHARLLERLTADGAKAVVFDIVFSDPNPAHPEGDARFARAIKTNAKVVLAAEYALTPEGNYAMIPPYAPFAHGAAALGFEKLWASQDILVRRHLHVPIEKDADSYSSMTWEAANLVGAAAAKNPDDRSRERWINYYGPTGAHGVIPVVSFQRAIETNEVCPSGFFSNRVVFIGGSLASQFSGVRKDEYRTPYTGGAELRPGLDIQATEFLNLLRGDWLTRARPPLEIAAVVLLGLLFGYGLALLRPRPATVLALLGALLIILVAQFLFWKQRVWFPWMIIVAAQIPVALLWSIIYNSVTAYIQNKLLEQSLSLYLSPKQVQRILKDPSLRKPGGSKQVVSILFSDIAGFSRVSEQLDPQELVQLLNNYYEATIRCIHQTDGTIVDIIGDAIFAIWNAPEAQPDHQERMVRAALLFQQNVTQFDGRQGNLALRTRVGLHTGEVVVGNVGSSEHFDYTAIGENVNLASRLEGLNKQLGTEVLLSRPATPSNSGQWTVREVGRFLFKGFGKVTEVNELITAASSSEQMRPWLETFATALAQFKQRDFTAAEGGFQRTIELRGEDGPSQFYLKQIAVLREYPLPENWAGDVELKEK